MLHTVVTAAHICQICVLLTHLCAAVFEAYRSDEGKPFVLPVVRSVEAQITADHTLNHEYLPIAGLPDLRTAAARLMLGENSRAIVENRVCTITM